MAVDRETEAAHGNGTVKASSAARRSRTLGDSGRFEVGSYATRATRGMLWTTLSSLGARGLGFAVTMLLTHWISRDDYGRANAAYTIAITLAYVPAFGFSVELVRRKERFEEAATLATLTTAFLWLCFGLAAYALAGALATLFNASTSYLRLALLIPTVLSLLFVPYVILHRGLRFGTQSALELLGSVGNLGLVLLLAMRGWGASAVLVGLIAREVVIQGGALLVTGLSWIQPPKADWPLLRSMMGFGLPLVVSDLLEFGVQNWDNLFVAKYFGAAALGPYAVAYTLAYTPVYTVTERVTRVILAIIARFADDVQRRRRALLRSLRAVMMILVVASVATMLCGPRVVRLLVDDAWAETVASLVYALAPVGIGLPLQLLPDCYLQAIGLPRSTMKLMALRALLLFAALLLFGRTSAVAAAWSVSAAFVCSGLIACALLAAIDRVRLDRIVVALVPAAVGSALAAFAVLGLRRVVGWPSELAMLTLELAAGAATYVAYLLLFHRQDVVEIFSALVGERGGRSGDANGQ